MASPLVSVIMPVFNSASFLHKAIDCILSQSFVDFEFIAVDDGSTDESQTILEDYSKHDSRFFLLRNKKNKGVTASLNLGLSQSKGDYIVRFDSDDICVPFRIETQLNYMEQNREIGASGSWVKLIGEQATTWRPPITPHDIHCHLLFRNALAHSSVIIRRSALEKAGMAYDPSFRFAQDYELWVRLSMSTRLANLPQFLTTYNSHSNRVSHRFAHQQIESANRVRALQIHRLGIEPTPDDIGLHVSLANLNYEKSETYLKKAELWLRRLQSQNRALNVYEELAFSQVLQQKWENLQEHLGLSIVPLL